jgi:FkbM family methyltransferase
MQNFLKNAARAGHNVIAKYPRLAYIYILIVSTISRNFLGPHLSPRVRNLLVGHGVEWPQLTFPAQHTTVGARTEILLIPHLGEFDQEVLFYKRLPYESPVFCWLEQHAADSYDAVVEIGANVGVYSLFFDALIRSRPDSKLKTIIAFEPALEPFFRLVQNLQVNKAKSVLPFRTAIADTNGFRSFFEPQDHLTNGSLLESFAGMFSSKVTKSIVHTISANDIGCFFENGVKVLVKIDVEGYEPQLLPTFQELARFHHPDFLIEVLPGTPEVLNSCEFLSEYERYLITPEGLKLRSNLVADEWNRDWFLRWPV